MVAPENARSHDQPKYVAIRARLGMTWKKEAVAFVEGRKDCRCSADWPTTTMRVKLADVIPWPEQVPITGPSVEPAETFGDVDEEAQ